MAHTYRLRFANITSNEQEKPRLDVTAAKLVVAYRFDSRKDKMNNAQSNISNTSSN
jgi:hypothetical protein